MTAISANSVATPFADTDKTSVNAIRCLAIDTVQKANSGHPGAPVGENSYF